MADLTDHELREHVRARYTSAALRTADRDATEGCGCGCTTGIDGCCSEATAGPGFGADLYTDHDTEGATRSAVSASLGCGVPTTVADLHEGETVLDLGSGAGADLLISAHRVGATGRAFGLEMTDEMLDLARTNAAEAGVTNAEFVKGYIEEIPLPDASVDVVISNCVINLPPTRRASSEKPPASCAPADASPSPTSSPTKAWTTPPAPTCTNGPAASPAPSPNPNTSTHSPPPGSARSRSTSRTVFTDTRPQQSSVRISLGA